MQRRIVKLYMLIDQQYHKQSTGRPEYRYFPLVRIDKDKLVIFLDYNLSTNFNGRMVDQMLF